MYYWQQYKENCNNDKKIKLQTYINQLRPLNVVIQGYLHHRVDRAIQVGGAGECQLFGLKI